MPLKPTNQGSRLWREIIIGLVLAFALLGVGKADASQSADFCAKNVLVHDYLTPLAGFPNSLEFANSGKLASGPGALRVYPPRNRLVTAGEPGGFESRGTLAGGPSHGPLRWWAVSRLIRVGKNADHRIVKARKQFIGTVKSFQGRNFGFSGPVPPGIYRLDIRFQNRRGKMVNHYAEIFRVLQARSDLRLVADVQPVVPGARGYLRVDNYGTITGTYFYEVRVWASNGSELNLGPQYVSQERPLARPGYAGECFQFPTPVDIPAGEYTVGVRATDRLHVAPQLLTAKFVVES